MRSFRASHLELPLKDIFPSPRNTLKFSSRLWYHNNGKDGKIWRIELLFFEVASFIDHPISPRSTQHCFSTLHKNYGYQKRKSRNSFFVDVFDGEACDCESQKYLASLFALEIKIVSFLLQISYVVKLKTWNEESCITRQPDDEHILCVVKEHFLILNLKSNLIRMVAGGGRRHKMHFRFQ